MFPHIRDIVSEETAAWIEFLAATVHLTILFGGGLILIWRFGGQGFLFFHRRWLILELKATERAIQHAIVMGASIHLLIIYVGTTVCRVVAAVGVLIVSMMYDGVALTAASNAKILPTLFSATAMVVAWFMLWHLGSRDFRSLSYVRNPTKVGKVVARLKRMMGANSLRTDERNAWHARLEKVVGLHNAVETTVVAS